MSYHAPFEPLVCYHLYNHAVGNENLFRSRENYAYFLMKYGHYAQHILDTYAFCLIPNHFHFLIQVKSYENLKAFFEAKASSGKRVRSSNQSISNQVGQQLGNWMNAYAKAYNKKYKRRGSLFVERVRRIKVADERYFSRLLNYIHWNPVHHGFVAQPEEWAYSSYTLKDAIKLRELPNRLKSNLEAPSADEFFNSIEFEF